MACLSVNRMDPVKKMEKALVMKKQQSIFISQVYHRQL